MIVRAEATDPDMFEIVSDVIQEAGTEALKFFNDQDARTVDTKSFGDFVSDADQAVEVLLRDRLRKAFPNIPVIGEELGGDKASTYWSVDPIDGTSNFLSGLPFWAVSIGLVDDGEFKFGAVYAPVLNLGAFADVSGRFSYIGMSHGSKPQVSRCFAVGRNHIWCKKDRQALEENLEEQGQSVVNFGSCAVSLLFVACGRLNGYAESNLSGIWDCAGGLALCAARQIDFEFAENPDGSVNVRTALHPSQFSHETMR